MKVYKVMVKEGGLSEHVIYVPRSLFKQVKESKITLVFGNRQLRVEVRTHRKAVMLIQVAKLSALTLGLPATQHLLGYMVGSRIFVGPIIGILSHKDPMEDTRGEFLEYLRFLVEAGPQLGYYVYIISPKNIKEDLVMVQGSILNEQGEWTKQLVPRPDIVYNQIISRNVERSELVQTAKRHIASWTGTVYFNEGYLNKWETTQILANVVKVRRYLPATVLYQDTNLLSFLEKYKEIYIKPDGGSLGKGIIKVQGSGNGYRVQQKIGRNQIVTRYPTKKAELKKIINNMTRGRTFIMQQGLNLAEVDGCVYDLRVLMQKNIRGKWQRSKLFGRLAAKGSFTSNISTGGKGLSAEVLINKAFAPSRAQKILEEVREASQLIAEAFEEAYGYLMGELGLDFGIDVNGRLWLIEINSKPHKSLTSREGNEELAVKALLKPLDYARYLWMTNKWS